MLRPEVLRRCCDPEPCSLVLIPSLETLLALVHLPHKGHFEEIAVELSLLIEPG